MKNSFLPSRNFVMRSIAFGLLISLVSTITNSAQAVAPTCADGGICQVGDTGPGGGLVFYVSSGTFEQVGATGSMCSTWCKYLEAAPSGWNGGSDPSKIWAVTALQTTDVVAIADDAFVYNNALGIGIGYKNSVAIVDQGNNTTTAAGIARGYTGGSKSDWYLPTTAELNLLCQWVRGVTPSATTRCENGSLNSSTYGAGSAGFSTNYYWSSSENLSQYGYVQQFRDGFQINNFKSLSFDVRPIRAFGTQPIAVVYVAPTPIPYLKTLNTPRLNLKDGKLVCVPGTYNAGYTLDGFVQGSTKTLFTPNAFTYNLLINGVAQTSLVVTSGIPINSWNLVSPTSGSLYSCSITVSLNSLTNTDKSSDNTSGVTLSLATQSTAVATANSDYSAALNANSKAYQKALVDNRTQWRSNTEKIRNDYYAERNKISSAPSTKATRALTSAALKAYTAAVKKNAADYKTSQPAALVAREAANTAALITRDTAIAKANATYGIFIESIGYGVLIP